MNRLSSILYFVPVVLMVCASTFQSRGQIRCPDFEQQIDGNTAMPLFFDQGRNLTFSNLYIASYGDSIDLVDWKQKRSIAEHLLIVGKHAQALDLLSGVHKLHPEDVSTVDLLARAYQMRTQPDSALALLEVMGGVGDLTHEYGPRYIQAQILRATIESNKSPAWILKNNVLKLDALRDVVQSVGQSDQILSTVMGFVWELENQVKITSSSDLVLARAFEEVADVMALQLSRRGASILYYVGLQYDPNNSLGIKSKFEENNTLIESCGYRVLSQEQLADTFRPIRDVSTVDYQYAKEMERVLAFQKKISKRSQMRWMIFSGLVIMVTAIWYFRFRFIRKVRSIE